MIRAFGFLLIALFVFSCAGGGKDISPGDTDSTDKADGDPSDLDPDSDDCSGSCLSASDTPKCMADDLHVCLCESNGWHSYACSEICALTHEIADGCGGGAGRDYPYCKCISSPLDGDLDEEEDREIEEDTESADDPIGRLPRCREGENIYPCHLDFPFTYTNDQGEFRVGFPKNWAMDGPVVWGNWIGFIYKIDEHTWPAGLMLFDYETKQTVMLAGKEEIPYGGYNIAIGDNRIVWGGYSDPAYNVSLFQSRLDRFEKNILLGTATNKKYLTIIDGTLFWNGGTEGSSDWDVYMLPSGSTTLQFASPLRSPPSARASVNQNRVVFLSGATRLQFVDLVEKKETTLIDDSYLRTSAILNGDFVYWSDLSLAADNSGTCGFSLFQYNLKTGQKEVLKRTSGWSDYFATSAWGDWLIYQDTHEGGGREGEHYYCYSSGAVSDVFLRYIPTGEEWNLSNHEGAQWMAMMWDHLVVWIDSRELPSSRLRYSDLYGVDLCMHPQLKDRFDSCKAAGREK